MANSWFTICVILSMFTTSSISANVFISIDCGSSTPFKDENGIAWVGDAQYLKTGESHSVSPNNSVSHVADSLRVFTNKNSKNCYIIDSVGPGRVLLRATFYYGNYDGKNSPPTFRLLFDGNFWSIVENSGPLPTLYEVIYTTRKESISVCVAQSQAGEFPYISALEVRGLEPYMYGDHVDDGYPLLTRRRVAFGTNATIRFPDDPYDRYWTADASTDGTIKVTNDAVFGNEKLTNDNPPPAVMKAAVTSVTLNSSIQLFMALPFSKINITVHINLYFSEVIRLRPSQTRSLYILMNNSLFSPPVFPIYGNCTQMIVTNISVYSNTSFSLVAAENSTLPPLINAMEVYRIGSNRINNGTHENDVGGLASLQEAFSLLQDWSGDPCLPKFYNWDWIKCNDDTPPRVTTLGLSGFRLKGFLPDFSSMDALHTINLSNNSLLGNLPDFLGSLPNLQILNVENNQLNGTIPASLSKKEGLILRVGGNPELCASNSSCPIPATPPPPANSSVGKRKNILEILVATIIPSIIISQFS